MSSVRTVRHVIESSLAAPLELVVTLPEDAAERKIPITIALGIQPNPGQLTKLCCYHYTIPNRHGSNIVGTTLLATGNDWIMDVTRQAATAMSKKFGRPCYVAWSAPANHDYNSVDQIYVVKQCLDYVHKL